jgi:predicted AlkP superfamily pyrophosphatase or phosphodiesterase
MLSFEKWIKPKKRLKTIYSCIFKIKHITLRMLLFSLGTHSCVSGSESMSTENNRTNAVQNCNLSKKVLSWNRNKPPKLIFMSLDGLNYEFLSEYVPLLSAPHPYGLKRILNHGNLNKQLIVQDPTITSSSHTSTITCSRPETHGIFANTQLHGDRKVSGFAHETKTETFASALNAAGYKVVSAGYPSLDNSEPGRTIAEGFAYGSTEGKAGQYLLTGVTEAIHSWKNKKDEVIGRISLKLGHSNRPEISCLEKGCRVTSINNDTLFDIKIVKDGIHATAYVIPIDADGRSFYVSALGRNNAFPKANQDNLNNCGLIFSAGKDISLEGHGPQPVIAGLEHRFNFFRQAWTQYLPQTDADILFLYLEDFDALRHQFSGNKSAELSVVKHIEKVDALLGSFLESLPPETNVVIMGDHGMSIVKFELNIRKIIPKAILDQTRIVTSGGTLLVYQKDASDGGLNGAAWISDLKNILSAFRINRSAKPVFEKIFSADDNSMKDAGLFHPDGPVFLAFANEDFALQDSLVDELILADTTDIKRPVPRPRGQHGHNNLNPKMRTMIGLWGPAFNGLKASQIKQNTDVVPEIAKALRLPVPVQCRPELKR